jgi:rhodanese-related sulfurtransferase
MDGKAEIDVKELAALRRSGGPCQIVDVREPWEADICSLPDALSLPLMSLPARLAEIARDRPVVVVCHHGVRSGQVVAWLRGQGFEKAVNLQGGIDAWAAEIDPDMATY